MYYQNLIPKYTWVQRTSCLVINEFLYLCREVFAMIAWQSIVVDHVQPVKNTENWEIWDCNDTYIVLFGITFVLFNIIEKMYKNKTVFYSCVNSKSYNTESSAFSKYDEVWFLMIENQRINIWLLHWMYILCSIIQIKSYLYSFRC